MSTTYDIDALRRLPAYTGCTPDELGLLKTYAERMGLDPFARQIFLVKRGGRSDVSTSVDGFRTVAQRSGAYEGQIGPHWCAEDGKWVDVWTAKGPPFAAKVAVLRTGFREPLVAVARWDEYAQPNSPMWKRMGVLMLAKCAESLALRRAFPQELGGVYTSEEMSQADGPQRSTKGKWEPLGGTGEAVEPDAEVQALANELGAMVEQVLDPVKRSHGATFVRDSARQPKARALALLSKFREKVVATLAGQAPEPVDVLPIQEAP